MITVRDVEKMNMKATLPKFRVGDTVEVMVRIVEGDKERTQIFTGTVIARRGSGMGEMFTVRRIVQGEGVERVFPIHAPMIESITIVRRGKVRRAKLYYLRDRRGKKARIAEVQSHHGGADADAPKANAAAAPKAAAPKAAAPKAKATAK